MEVAPKAEEKLSRVRQRQKLIEACISALYLHGPSRTTIDKVVSIADMSPGIVNFYFETKAALLVAALEFLAEEFEDRVLAPLAALRDQPVLALEKLIALYLDAEIASPRKVSVWYAFWGEASSRSEYYAICGKRDEAFADLVRDLVDRLIVQSSAVHLDADAVALGLVGSLEMIWQEIAFHDESELDRDWARQRCLAYLRSVFPEQFVAPATASLGAGRSRATRLAGSRAKNVQATLRRTREASRLLLAAEMILAGVPACVTPQNWPGCDLLAEPEGQGVQRVLVRVLGNGIGSPQIEHLVADGFDWLAIVLWPASTQPQRRYFLVPRDVADRGGEGTRQFDADGVTKCFARYEGNFALRREL